jgi:hypothetical protein
MAAGCFILTNPLSGNIQDFIQKKPNLGIVLKNEQELLDIFLRGKIIRVVEEYQKEGKPQGEILFSVKK